MCSKKYSRYYFSVLLPHQIGHFEGRASGCQLLSTTLISENGRVSAFLRNAYHAFKNSPQPLARCLALRSGGVVAQSIPGDFCFPAWRRIRTSGPAEETNSAHTRSPRHLTRHLRRRRHARLEHIAIELSLQTPCLLPPSHRPRARVMVWHALCVWMGSSSTALTTQQNSIPQQRSQNPNTPAPAGSSSRSVKPPAAPWMLPAAS